MQNVVSFKGLFRPTHECTDAATARFYSSTAVKSCVMYLRRKTTLAEEPYKREYILQKRPITFKGKSPTKDNIVAMNTLTQLLPDFIAPSAVKSYVMSL